MSRPTLTKQGKEVYRDRWAPDGEVDTIGGQLRLMVDENLELIQLQIDRYLGERLVYRVFIERAFDDILSLSNSYYEDQPGRYTTLRLMNCTVLKQGKRTYEDYDLMDLAVPTDHYHALETRLLELHDEYGPRTVDEAPDQGPQTKFVKAWNAPTPDGESFDSYRLKIVAHETGQMIELECEIEGEGRKPRYRNWTGTFGDYMDALNHRLEKGGLFYLNLSGCSDQPLEEVPMHQREGRKRLTIKMTNQVSEELRKWNNELFQRSIRAVS